ncbi:TonB-dependent receptor [Methylomonas sp. EFPC3]|uniref:TonB-dependent receptor plug domain-containing protein n=1 Tax=Methylomonas sp. EFPC3 TaxID=3021710 RepID=UPI00241665F4|nr:TonB-dependent receptor [Methylomonas sp. EFPC3]WFP49371.1 TonB-dependent receptor [Methylomonas sp. EFPC3]
MIGDIRSILLLCAAFSQTRQVHAGDESLDRLKTLSLQELTATTVSLAAKSQQTLQEAAAAAYVISNEEIRRSGMQSIPEILRKVPGLEVARVDANQWAITSRGFNGAFANKLLVMVDGRTVYDPFNSGVYWNEQDYPLEDIDRIEVIRGPGATMWGSNAVNGVINIVTRTAQESQGTLVSAGASHEEPGFGTLRYGGQLNPDLHYRVYGKYNHRDDFHFSDGSKASDNLDLGRAGFRSDWTPNAQETLTLQGDYFNGTMQQTLTGADAAMPDRMQKQGGNLLLRWQRTLANGNRVQIRSYFDHATRQQMRLDHRRDTFDFDVQHSFHWRSHATTWGAGYRFNSDQLTQKLALLTFDQARRDLHLFNLFAQDEWRPFGDAWRLIYGGKLEHNDFTGFELQPTARLLWSPDQQHSVWAAVSRAVRVPSRVEHDLNLLYNFAPGVTTNIRGGDSFKSETALSYELGYRFFPNRSFNLDTTLFYCDYARLSTTEPQTPIIGVGGVLIPYQIANMAQGETYGWETALNWRASEFWRLQGSYSLFGMAIHKDPQSLDSAAAIAEGNSPRQRFNLSAYINLPNQLEFDSHWYYTDRLANGVSAYHRLDLRLGWQPSLHLELAAGVQNLLDNRHLEFIPPQDNPVLSSEMERNYYLKATLRF